MPAPRNRPKISFLTAGDPFNRRTWSGTYHYMGKALERHCGPVSYLGPVGLWQETARKAANRASMLLLRKRYDYKHSAALGRIYGRIFSDKLAASPPDVIFAPAASTELAFLETRVPAVYLSDITAPLAREYYDWYSNLLGRSVRDIALVEKLAVGRAGACVYPTAWAANSARTDLGVDGGRVHIVPFGANVDDIPPADEIVRRKKTGRCRLLFLGVDWERKGGAIAHRALLSLIRMGIDAELTVCGCVPPGKFAHERMKVVPFLDKNDPARRGDFGAMMSGSDFLLLPTRAEAFGIVFCEASAFGLPSISTKTGGVPDVVKDGVNGYTLPPEAGGDAYAELIARIFSDDAAFERLVRSSRAAYDGLLNWDAWGRSMKTIIDGVLS